MPSFHQHSDKHFSKKVDHWSNDNHYKPEPTKSAPASETTTSVPTPETAPKTGPVPVSESTTSMNQTELETALLKLINDDRAKAGAKPLTMDSELTTAARDHSAWMDSVDTLSHTGKNGSSPSDRIESAGYDFVRSAENIAYIAGSRADVMDMSDVNQLHTNLMNSPGHHANLMNPALTEIGIGLKHGDMKGMSAVFVTEDFGTPTASEGAVGLVGVNPTSGHDAFHT